MLPTTRVMTPETGKIINKRAYLSHYDFGFFLYIRPYPTFSFKILAVLVSTRSALIRLELIFAYVGGGNLILSFFHMDS